jgi:hypothetical protein
MGKNEYEILTGKPDEKKPLGTYRCKKVKVKLSP